MLRRALLLAAVAVAAAAPPAAARMKTVAALSGPATVTAGERATFDASSSVHDPAGEIVEFAWDLDGNGSFEEVRQGPRITIVPAAPGERIIAVRVTDELGATSTALGHYLVQGAPPVARLSAPVSVLVGAPVTFDASSSTSTSGSIVAYAWNLDGEGFGPDSTDPRATTTFPAAGTYTVAVRVRDSAQGQATVRRQIEVTVPGQAPTRTPASGEALGGSTELGIAPLDPVAQRWVQVGSKTRFAAINGAARRRLGAAKRGLWVNLLSDRAARFTLAVHVPRKAAKRMRLRGKTVVKGYVRIARARYDLAAAGQRPLKIVLPRKVRRKLRAPVKLLVRGKATDAAGNRTRVSRAFALRR